MLNMQEKSSLDPRQWGVVAKIVEGLQGCSFQHEGVLWTEVLGQLKNIWQTIDSGPLTNCGVT